MFLVAAVMLGIATAGALGNYASGIRYLASLYPTEWPTIYKFDVEMRDHQWPRLVERIAQGLHDPNRLADIPYSAERQWNYILMATRCGLSGGPLTEWWDKKKEWLSRRPLRSDHHQDSQPAPGDHDVAMDIQERVRTAVQAGIQQGGRSSRSSHQSNQHTPPGIRCHLCGREGHMKRDCWFLPTRQKGRGKGMSKGMPEIPKMVKNTKGKHGKGKAAGKGRRSWL